MGRVAFIFGLCVWLGPTAAAPCFLLASLSLPEDCFESYRFAAHKRLLPIYLRGIWHNDLSEFVRTLGRSKPLGSDVRIDPLPFKKFKVSVVPTLVCLDGKAAYKISGLLPLSDLMSALCHKGVRSACAKGRV